MLLSVEDAQRSAVPLLNLTTHQRFVEIGFGMLHASESTLTVATRVDATAIHVKQYFIATATFHPGVMLEDCSPSAAVSSATVHDRTFLWWADTGTHSTVLVEVAMDGAEQHECNDQLAGLGAADSDGGIAMLTREGRVVRFSDATVLLESDMHGNLVVTSAGANGCIAYVVQFIDGRKELRSWPAARFDALSIAPSTQFVAVDIAFDFVFTATPRGTISVLCKLPDCTTVAGVATARVMSTQLPDEELILGIACDGGRGFAATAQGLFVCEVTVDGIKPLWQYHSASGYHSIGMVPVGGRSLAAGVGRFIECWAAQDERLFVGAEDLICPESAKQVGTCGAGAFVVLANGSICCGTVEQLYATRSVLSWRDCSLAIAPEWNVSFVKTLDCGRVIVCTVGKHGNGRMATSIESLYPQATPAVVRGVLVDCCAVPHHPDELLFVGPANVAAVKIVAEASVVNLVVAQQREISSPLFRCAAIRGACWCVPRNGDPLVILDDELKEDHTSHRLSIGVAVECAITAESIVAIAPNRLVSEVWLADKTGAAVDWQQVLTVVGRPIAVWRQIVFLDPDEGTLRAASGGLIASGVMGVSGSSRRDNAAFIIDRAGCVRPVMLPKAHQ